MSEKLSLDSLRKALKDKTTDKADKERERFETVARRYERAVRQLRRALPSEVALWLGGSGSEGLSLPAGADRIEGIEELEQKVLLQEFRR